MSLQIVFVLFTAMILNNVTVCCEFACMMHACAVDRQ